MSVLVLLLVAIVTVAILLVDSTTRVNSAWEGTNRILLNISNKPGTDLTLNDFNRLSGTVSDFTLQLRRAESRVNLVAPIVRVPANGRVTLDLLAVTRELAQAANAMLEGAEPTIVFITSGEDDDEVVASGVSSGERIVELLDIGQGRFRTARDHLAEAERILDTIDVTNASPDIGLQLEQIRAYHGQLQEINQLLFAAPDLLTTLLGLDSQRTYLLLFPNNDELRPSGGYNSEWGWLTVNSGRITNINVAETSAVSPNPPPESFVNTFTIPDWWIPYREPVYAAWDGSWYADFPSTAALASGYYTNGGNPFSPTSGIISIDVSGFEFILQGVGEVLVPGYGRVIDTENFREILYTPSMQSIGLNAPQSDSFRTAAFRAILTAWQNLPPDQTPLMLGALLQAVQEKHLMLYVEDANDAIEILGWGGQQITPENHDYLMIVDANVSGATTSQSVVRNTTYDATINADGTVDGRLSVRYDFSAEAIADNPAIQDPPRTYANLMQVFFAPDTDVTGTDDLDDFTMVDTESHTALVSQFNVGYDEVERFIIQTTTPPVVDDIGAYKRYRLLIQKQAGIPTQEVTVQVQLPEGARFISATPEADATFELENLTLDFRLEVVNDMMIEVIYAD